MRRLLAHSQGFEIPESVEIDQRGIAMLVSSVATMRLHAQEAHAAAPTHIVAPEGNKALMGFFAKPKGVRPGDSGDNSSEKGCGWQVRDCWRVSWAWPP